MKREDRYLVIKRKDVVDCLTVSEMRILEILTERIEAFRAGYRGKGALKCVVVEHDWPEFEKVWAMIEARVDGKVLRYKTETSYQDLPNPEEQPIEVLDQNNPFKSLLDDVEPDPDTVDD